MTYHGVTGDLAVRKVDTEAFLGMAARLFHVARREVMDARRWYAYPARHAVYLALQRRGYSDSAIGRKLRRHHTSVGAMARKALEREAHDPVYAEKVRQLVEIVA